MVNQSTDIRVAIFEDNPIMMDAYSAILNGSPGFVCTGKFTSCNNWKHDIERSKPDVVLMDIEMSGLNGIEATKQIKGDSGCRVLIQTVFEDDARIFEAICAGASGYILKNTSPVKLLEAVADVFNGGAAFSPTVAAKISLLFQKYVSPSVVIHDYQLTSREKEILQLLTEGVPMPRIAERVFLSYHTVRDHIKNIYQKLHVASATQAVSKAIRENLV